jgi:two-component system CheB/CheR fusion protein
MDLKVKQPAAHLIVGIGASAGGLEAFSTFFAHMPADSGMSFVLVQHLSPDHVSLLADLVGRATAMPVQEATHNTPPSPNQVYVIPPNATLTMADGMLHVETPAPPRDHRKPINSFFTSLAEDQGEDAVCIVLSGTGSDGALGLSAIKEHGGLTLAQAGFDHAAMSGMPSSAAETGFVDSVLPVEEMPARLAAYQLERGKDDATTDDDKEGADHATDHSAAICALLRARRGQDFSHYKQKTLTRRIHRRMLACKVATAPDYIALVKETPAELDALFREFLIGVTEFFRDPEAFSALREQVIAPLLRERAESTQIRIWVPGCATGEEAYSLAMLVAEEIEKLGQAHDVQILATDIDEHAIAQARSGRYPIPSPGLPQACADRWFAPDGDMHAPIKSIRNMCVFSTHNVVQDPPFSKLDLISCRNLLIYFEPELQDRAMHTFHYALRSGGALFLGPSEGVNGSAELFACLDKKHRIYRTRDDGRVQPETPSHPAALIARPRPLAPSPVLADDHFDKSARRVLEAFSPAYVIVDKNNDIRRFSGSEAGRFLETSAGHASLGLFSMLCKPLRPIVRAALVTMAKTRKPVVHDRAAIKLDGESKSVKVVVAPMAETEAQAGYYIVAFQEMNAAAPHADLSTPDEILHANIQSLEDELFTVKTQLEASISEFGIVNEEMRGANEEYQSVNEELQSSNEELETTKEEMQSVNEELQTINGEMIVKNELLVRVNSDLKNVLESTDIATLFLDNELRVKSFTPGMTDLFHLRDADRHRPIQEIVTRLSYPDLALDADRVFHSLAVLEREVESPETGAAYIMRIRPYRRIDNLLDGVVITFVDITDRKRADGIIRQHAALVEFSRDGLIGLDLNSVVTSWNPGAERLLLYSAKEAIGRPLQDFAPEARRMEQSGLVDQAKAGKVGQSETVARRRDGVEVDVELVLAPVLAADGSVVSLSTCVRDIAQGKEADARTAMLVRELDHRVKNILAVVSALISQTLKGSPTPEEFALNIQGRIGAITMAHDLLTQNIEECEASLRNVVVMELAPFHQKERSITIENTGVDVALKPNAVLAFALTIHELASNAAKFGAFSTSEGRLAISWQIHDAKEGRILHFLWKESGGPVVTPPTRRGFGSVLIERSLVHQFKAKVNREFLPAGLRCAIDLPLTEAVGRASFLTSESART